MQSPRRHAILQSEIYIGIRARNDSLAVAALRGDRPCIEVDFPATPLGLQAIRGVLDDYEEQFIRLAVSGSQAVDLAFALGNAPHRETFVVPARVADTPGDLARFASRAV